MLGSFPESLAESDKGLFFHLAKVALSNIYCLSLLQCHSTCFWVHFKYLGFFLIYWCLVSFDYNNLKNVLVEVRAPDNRFLSLFLFQEPLRYSLWVSLDDGLKTTVSMFLTTACSGCIEGAISKVEIKSRQAETLKKMYYSNWTCSFYQHKNVDFQGTLHKLLHNSFLDAGLIKNNPGLNLGCFLHSIQLR